MLIAAGADIVKFEGARPEIVEALAGPPSRSAVTWGSSRSTMTINASRGARPGTRMRLLRDAIALDEAGMAMLVLELVPEEVAGRVTKSIKAPTIGIGAGRKTDGQVLVISDVLGFGQRISSTTGATRTWAG